MTDDKDMRSRLKKEEQEHDHRYSTMATLQTEQGHNSHRDLKIQSIMTPMHTAVMMKQLLVVAQEVGMKSVKLTK